MKIKHYKSIISFIFTISFMMAYCLYLGWNNGLRILAASEEDKEKTIYLTFDDGPSVQTDKILDILKENNVKATFFLIGNQIADQEAVVKRIHDEGHAIGLHSFCHNYKKLYPSKQGFIKEMIKCQDEINRVTGTKPNILRFPWGSRNHLNKKFLDELHSNNFKVYDWNAYMSDGINYKTSVEKLYKEATRTTITEYPIILVMHCDYMHKNTCKALPRVIKFYKDKGFEFKAIIEETPEYYFPLKN